MKITTNAIVLVASRVCADFLSLVLFVFISRHFGPVGIGDFSYGFAIAGLVFVAVCLGLDGYGVRQYSQLPPAARSPWLAELLAMQLFTVAVAAVVAGAYLLLTAATAATLAAAVALTLYQVLVAFSRTLFIPAMAHEEMLFPALADIVSRAVAVGSAILAITLGTSLGNALLGFPLAGVVLVAASAGSAVRHGVALRIRMSGSAVARIGSTLWSYAAAEVMMQLYMRIGLLVLTLHAGVATTGIYASGLKLLELACMPLIFIGVAAYPRLIRLHESNMQAFRNLSNNMLWIMAAMSGTLAWGLYFIAPNIIIPLLGPKFAGSESVVRAMSAVGAVQAAESILWSLLLSAGLQVARVRVIAVSTALNVSLNLVLIPQWGIDGAITASCISFATIVGQSAFLLRRSLSTRLLLQVFGTLCVALASEVAAGWLLRGQEIEVQASGSLTLFVLVLTVAYWRSRRAVASQPTSPDSIPEDLST